MESKIIQGKSIREWKKQYPLMNKIISTEEVFWTNSKYGKFEDAIKKVSLTEEDVKDAEERLKRFAPYIAKVFPETQKTNGIIESPVVKIPNMQRKIEEMFNKEVLGELLLKCDSHLAISGSIKARGGIYEVLKHAEDLAIENNMLTIEEDYSILDSDKFRKFFSKNSIAVGSTGNLGLSIGIMSAQLGFKVYVHMSADAKQWKKDLLRSKGVTVVEYASDYSKAVEEGRKQAEADPNMYFVDDENSTNLFLGYAVAAYRLKKQLEEINVVVDEEHPLFVYLPCGVGGGPGGVAFGLKLVFKDNVHCFFAEPTHSPCMLIGLMTDMHDKVCVQDFGIDNITAADGLAVGRASGFVGKTLKNLISGAYTAKDEKLYVLLSTLIDSENIYLEPSALAGIPGCIELFKDEAGKKYIENNNLKDKMKNASHIAWATGGSMVPKDVMETYYKKGKELSSHKI
ncbi:serine ammonia-lyase [Clostridium carboxidivorans P7]|uniref:Probable D-serine dehydratase n=1 Tax=Clostridium carboxidivorans P7 TaxID=536227 RepID=C6PQ61_9CLOT|nr:D-serine ammonia-lyase [Clostridium carboxidivorans]AKN29621.1 serine ammonia-lyase [Clostridium carboxidivorans P7]EET88666.1 D-serine ammonia-lyase [Clostridium carboxidivorans P7]EFG89454.1 D-serine ammonia-lyase [Clostridium carboxidivorans P7]